MELETSVGRSIAQVPTRSVSCSVFRVLSRRLIQFNVPPRPSLLVELCEAHRKVSLSNSTRSLGRATIPSNDVAAYLKDRLESGARPCTPNQGNLQVAPDHPLNSDPLRRANTQLMVCENMSRLWTTEAELRLIRGRDPREDSILEGAHNRPPRRGLGEGKDQQARDETVLIAGVLMEIWLTETRGLVSFPALIPSILWNNGEKWVRFPQRHCRRGSPFRQPKGLV